MGEEQYHQGQGGEEDHPDRVGEEGRQALEEGHQGREEDHRAREEGRQAQAEEEGRETAPA